VRGEVVAQALGANVGNAVALRIVPADLRRPGEVQAQAVRRTEPWAFAEQNDHHARLEALADFVGNRHATLFD